MPALAPVAASELPATASETPAAEPAVEKPAKGKKGAKKKAKHKKTKVAKNKKVYHYVAIKDRLPKQIYKKYYEADNRHLPVAYYESDYDQFMFINAMDNDTNAIRSLMHTGRSANMVDHDGDTPLIVAVRSDSVDAARLLLAHNADMTVKDKHGMTVLQIAKQVNDPDMLDALEAGPNQ